MFWWPGLPAGPGVLRRQRRADWWVSGPLDWLLILAL